MSISDLAWRPVKIFPSCSGVDPGLKVLDATVHVSRLLHILAGQVSTSVTTAHDAALARESLHRPPV